MSRTFFYLTFHHLSIILFTVLHEYPYNGEYSKGYTKWLNPAVMGQSWTRRCSRLEYITGGKINLQSWKKRTDEKDRHLHNRCHMDVVGDNSDLCLFFFVWFSWIKFFLCHNNCVYCRLDTNRRLNSSYSWRCKGVGVEYNKCNSTFIHSKSCLLIPDRGNIGISKKEIG